MGALAVWEEYLSIYFHLAIVCCFVCLFVCLVLFSFVWFCLVLFGFVWFCFVSFRFVSLAKYSLNNLKMWRSTF